MWYAMFWKDSHSCGCKFSRIPYEHYQFMYAAQTLDECHQWAEERYKEHIEERVRFALMIEANK